jgi:signal transduction histidine kinase
MTHIAIAEALDGKAVDWMEQVSDEQYPALLHLLRMQDEERRRIGREIHGGLGQYLSVLKMKLDSMGSSQATAEENTECANLVEECVKEVRTISYLLYPPMLEEIGLTSAIPWYLEGFSKRSGIKTSFEAASTPEPAGGNEPSPGILFCSGLAFAT